MGLGSRRRLFERISGSEASRSFEDRRGFWMAKRMFEEEHWLVRDLHWLAWAIVVVVVVESRWVWVWIWEICDLHGIRKTSKTKLHSKVRQLPFTQEIKDKMILDGNTSSGLGEPSKAQLDNESEVRMYIVFPTIKFKLEHYPTISAGPPNLEEARIWKDSHLKLLERAAVSRASEKLCDSFDFMFSANLTEDDVKKVEGMDEVQDVLLDGFYVC